MSNLQSRLDKLEKSAPIIPPLDPAWMKPSEIVRLADELIANGATVTDEVRARLDALRRVTG